MRYRSSTRRALAPLRLTIAPQAPPRVNLLVPTLDLANFFGGYIAKLNLALRLVRAGLRVRLVTVDYCLPLTDGQRRQLSAYEGLEGFFEAVEVAHVYDRARPCEVSPDDPFVASTWWTAHVAHQAATQLGRRAFVYLIQEYEPFTFPMGAFAALARQSYDPLRGVLERVAALYRKGDVVLVPFPFGTGSPPRCVPPWW